MKKTALVVSSVFALFFVWILAEFLVGNEFLLPGPWSVILAIGDLLSSGSGWSAIGMTLGRLGLAMALALMVGLILGVIAGLKPAVALFLKPFITIFRTVPVISIVIIILILFGFETTPYLITFLMIFPLFFQAISEGIRNIEPELIDVYKLEDDRFFSGILHCYVPLIAPQIRTSLLQSAGLGIKVLVMAEFLAQTRPSIGNMLYLEKVNLRFDYVFAWTAILIVIAIVLEALIERYAGKPDRPNNGLTNIQPKND